MRVSPMPDTCTARHFYDMLRDYARDDAFARQEQQIIGQLNLAKNHRIVNVFAFLIEGCQTKSARQLESLGFTRVADYHNYKYPDTSRRLWMYSMDMNNWTHRALTPQQEANPFAAQAARPAGAGRFRYHNAWYQTPRQQGRIRRTTVEAFMNGKFPVGVWVDVPFGVTECPVFLRHRQCIVQTTTIVNDDQRTGGQWDWRGAGRSERGCLIAVKRVS